MGGGYNEEGGCTMNFTSLLYFIEAARSRSLTEAAARLHMTQQALSAHMAGLEAEYGCQLLVRRVPLALTPAGETLYTYALDMRTRAERMERHMAEIAGDRAGHLRIGIAPMRGRVLLPEAIAHFQKEWPHVTIRLEEAANALLIQRVTRGDLDLAIADFPPDLTGLVTKEFYRERLALVLSDKLAETLYGNRIQEMLARVAAGDAQPLAGCPFLMNSRGNIAGSRGRKWLHRAGITPRVLVESENLETLMTLALLGHGAFFSPENLARTMSGGAPVHIIPIPETGYAIRFGWREEDSGWRILQRFVEKAVEIRN